MLRIVDSLKAGRHATIVALGDSNTELTFHTRGRLNWAGLLAEALFETYGNGRCAVINAGVCGSTFREALGRLDRDVLRFKADLVILALGMNDAGRGEAGLGDFRAAVRETVERIRADGCGEILIRTPNPVVAVNGLPISDGAPRAGAAWETPARPVRAYAAALANLARELDCACVDHYSLWTRARFPQTPPVADPNWLWMRMSDAVHPGPQGHLAFFRELAPLFGVPAHFPWEDEPLEENRP